MSREMKDSGVEWIGEIPKDWNCCKQKYRRAFSFQRNGKYQKLNILLSALMEKEFQLI